MLSFLAGFVLVTFRLQEAKQEENGTPQPQAKSSIVSFHDPLVTLQCIALSRVSQFYCSYFLSCPNRRKIIATAYEPFRILSLGVYHIYNGWLHFGCVRYTLLHMGTAS